MKCEDCSHAEMCKWIDELEGRGCDFLSQGQISLNDINNALEASFRNGVRSAKVEQDAISRETIEDIKADIESARYGLINDGLDVALRIIDKHCPSCGAKMESEEQE